MDSEELLLTVVRFCAVERRVDALLPFPPGFRVSYKINIKLFFFQREMPLPAAPVIFLCEITLPKLETQVLYKKRIEFLKGLIKRKHYYSESVFCIPSKIRLKCQGGLRNGIIRVCFIVIGRNYDVRPSILDYMF